MLVSVNLWLKKFNDKAVLSLIKERFLVTVYYNPLSPLWPGYVGKLQLAYGFPETDPEKLADNVEKKFRVALEILRKNKVPYTLRWVKVEFTRRKPENAEELGRIAREAVLRVFEGEEEARQTLVYEQ